MPGNKDAGRELRDMPFMDYTNIMGGNVSNLKNTGVSFTNYEVYKYFKILRNYALRRCKWRDVNDKISVDELKLIEYYIFNKGYCAMIRPKCTRNGVHFVLKQPKIFPCTFAEYNFRSKLPTKISIFSGYNTTIDTHLMIDTNYDYNEFVIFTDDFLMYQDTLPNYYLAWEYACKLHEVDLAFNANSHKMRFPMVFSSAGYKKDKTGNENIFVNIGAKISEIMRSAFGRNEQFVEIPDNMIGRSNDGGLMLEPKSNNYLLEYLEAQKNLYQAYFEILGFKTDRTKQGAYKVELAQREEHEPIEYIKTIARECRLECALKANKVFGVELSLEMM